MTDETAYFLQLQPECEQPAPSAQPWLQYFLPPLVTAEPELTPQVQPAWAQVLWAFFA
jgi:hypothetical protein